MDMLKFIRGKGQQPSAERQKQQRELFAFRNTLHHGFPNKPTAVAWDPELRLLAIGTASGAIKVIGQPGVEFYGQHHSSESPVMKMVFLPNQGRLVTLCDDNSLHLWEMNESSLEEVKSEALEGKLKKISALCLESAGENLLLGTEGGNIYLLNVHTFEMADTIIYQDIVIQKVPDDYKISPGAVEAICEHPGHPDKILIGYNRGLMVLWNRTQATTEQTYINTQEVESICWHDSGTKFASSHNDGSYALYDVANGHNPLKDPITLYGPFPCKAITKLLWRKAEGDDLILFAGGLPRATHYDRHSITAVRGKKHVAFDFTSKVIDFFTIDPKEGHESAAGPEALVVLVEEEMVVIDLHSEDWLPMNMPYLQSVHASSVTCSQYVSDVTEELWEQLEAVGRKQTEGYFSTRKWPIDGGRLTEETQEPRDLLLTGHEDGSVRFWAAGGVALRPLYKLTTANLFSGDDMALDPVAEDDDDNEWPPFRKVGSFDPYSDDPRLAVKKTALCPTSGTLVVAGTAGHVVVAELGQEHKEEEISVTVMNIVLDRDGFVWKGHDQLSVRGGKIAMPVGFQPTAVLQLHPPVAVTALMLHSDWGLVAAGTAHGLALFDYVRHKPVITKCTLNPNDLSGVGEQAISRRKSFKKSLRESFRRLRKGRSTRHADKRGGTAITAPSIVSPASPTAPERRKEGAADAASGTLEPKPVERQVEARPADDSQGSMVRCVYLARTFLISVQHTTPTMWAGTNNGTVYVFTVSVPQKSRRKDEDVSCQLGKEIQLKHRAPVIGIAVVDSTGAPLPEPLEKAAEPVGAHRVIISSEEQFKMFTLPSLKPLCKLKLTAHEGSRVRRTAVAKFKSIPSAIPQHSEWCLVCLTNLGDCIVLSTPDLRRQLNAAVIRREDVYGIYSLCFTRHGEALYLHSSSELQRVTLSAQRVTQAYCELDLPPGVRPAKQEHPVAETSKEKAEAPQEDKDKNKDKDEDEDEEDNTQAVQVEMVVNQAGDVKVDAAPENKNDEKDDSHPSPSTPSPAPRTTTPTNTNTTLVNGDAEPTVRKDASRISIEEPKENGVSSEEERLEISMGDITIDSVKDHLINCSTTEEGRVVTEKVEVRSSSGMTESVVVKTTTTIINSCEDNSNISAPALIESNDVENLGSTPRRSFSPEISQQKAPLALMEDLEGP